jgi:hypothetical protein
MRWITLLGRIGTVLLMVGLALALISLIPPATIGFTTRTKRPVMPEEYYIAHSRAYTPQTGLRITVKSNNSVYVYLLSASRLQIENWTRTWVKETFPDLDEAEIVLAMHNVTVLDEVLQIHPDVILRKSPSSANLSYDFFPSSVLNVTAIVVNPSSDLVETEFEITSITTLAPKERVIVPAQWLFPIGVVLAAPWLILTKTKRLT